MYQTDMYEGMLAETVWLTGHNGETINAYFARPLGPGPFPGVVLAHHFPGWDEWYKEAARKFAHHGYAAISPNLYYRTGHGSPDDVAAKVRAEGGIPDEQAVGDLAGARAFLSGQAFSSGKTGVFGTCSGGRLAYLAGCQLDGFGAVIDCWGGRVVMANDDLSPMFPVAPIDLTEHLSCPVLGLFGEEDHYPSPEQVAVHEERLIQFGKEYEFHMYPDAGHGFFYYHSPAYRPQQAVDGWGKIFKFLEKNLAG